MALITLNRMSAGLGTLVILTNISRIFSQTPLITLFLGSKIPKIRLMKSAKLKTPLLSFLSSHHLQIYQIDLTGQGQLEAVLKIVENQSPSTRPKRKRRVKKSKLQEKMMKMKKPFLLEQNPGSLAGTKEQAGKTKYKHSYRISTL